MTRLIYLDNAATTKIDDAVLEAMMPYLKEQYGNASALYQLGSDARDAVENARRVIANSIDADFDEVVFTSGGTESNNTAIKTIAINSDCKHIITTKIEHPSVDKVCKILETQGFNITYLDVDENGHINIEQLEQSLKQNKTAIVSIIHANNVIGTIQKIKEIYDLVKKYDSILHIDACQSYTKIKLNAHNADLITLNAHKIHGPKGIGALYVSKDIMFKSWQQGGTQEFNKRAGTEAVALIVGFAKAVELKTDYRKVKELRDYFVNRTTKEIPEVRINHDPDGLPNIANLSFKAVEGESILLQLDAFNIAVNTGSACSSKTLEADKILLSIGLSHEQAHSSIRFSFSKYNTKDEVDIVIEKLKVIIEKLRSMSPFWS